MQYFILDGFTQKVCMLYIYVDFNRSFEKLQ